MGRKAARQSTESKAGMGLTGDSVPRHGGYKDRIESMSNSVREVKSLLASPISRHRALSPVRGGTVQKPSMEIVPVEEEPSLEIVSVQEKPSREIVAVDESSDHKESVVVQAGQLQSHGGLKDDPDDVKKPRHGFSADTLWGKFLRKMKINSLLGRPHGIPRKSPDPTRDHPQKARGKRSHWVRSLRSVFVHSKQKHQEKSSGKSETQPKYLLVKDGRLPPRPIVPSQDGSLKLLWKLTDSEVQIHANISMTDGSAKEMEESIPLLGYPELLDKPDAVGAGEITVRPIAPPWVLRKWKMKDSQKLLRIHPEKNILFQPIDDANHTYSGAIILQNRTNGYVAFKFKGTCPHTFATKPKHGLLGPNLTIKVDAFRYGDPFLPSGRQKADLFVIMTLPVPASLIKNKAVDCSVFRQFEDQCRCEGVLRAIFRAPETQPERTSYSYDSEADEQARIDDLYRSLILSRLTSIPESEPGSLTE